MYKACQVTFELPVFLQRTSAEQISARTAAVMNMKTQVMRYEDHIAAGPPARMPRKKTDLG